MAVSVNTEALPEKGEGKERKKETKYIKAGNRVARLVGYVEQGIHKQMFKGQPAKYESGKKRGQEKPAVLHIALTFEFPAEEYTGEYPLTISTSRRMKNGEFFDALTVPASLADGTMSKGYAMKTKFMKFLTSMQAATGQTYASLADFAAEQSAVMINVTNKKGKRDEETGVQPVYANMKPDGIMPPRFEHPVTGEVQLVEVPPAIETYAVFDWDAPTKEAWEALPPWHKETIKAALNFGGSPIEALLEKHPELDQDEDQDQTDGKPAEPNGQNVTPADMAGTQEDIPV
jgi:hypothetical protein